MSGQYKCWEIINKQIKENAILNNENDIEFIKGSIELKFTPQANRGYFIVKKNGIKRKFTIEKYFDLELENWALEIDKANTKIKKIQLQKYIKISDFIIRK